MAGSKSAIFTAAGANLAIAAAKFVGWGLTGSAAMLAEGVHSVVDTLNQILLLVGMKRAERRPDAAHPFGYGREIYFYAFVVALLIFLVGGIYSIYEGVEKLAHPEEIGEVAIFGLRLPGIVVNVAILGFAFVAEGYSFVVAVSAMPQDGGSPLSVIRRSKAPSLFVVLIEDFAALGGLALALVGVLLAHWLAMPALDGAASIAIGLLLVGMAVFLMVETHGLLIGEAADPEVVTAIENLIRDETAVRHVNEILTQHFGPDDILVNVSLDVRNDICAEAVEAMVARLDKGLRRRIAAVRRVFIEIQARPGEGRPAPRTASSETAA